MSNEIEKIIADEARLLAGLLKVGKELLAPAEYDAQLVAASLAKRDALMAELAALEERAAPLRAARALTPAEKELAKGLFALNEELARQEGEILARYDAHLEEVKTQALGVEQGRVGMLKYLGPMRHLSRFQDRKG